MKEILGEISNLVTLEESYNTNLELIVSCLDSKSNERGDISVQIEEIFKEENENFLNKCTLEDMIHIIEEDFFQNKKKKVDYNPAINSQRLRGSTIKGLNSNMNNTISEHENNFILIHSINQKVDECSFYHLNLLYLTNRFNLSTEMLVTESNKKLNDNLDKLHKIYDTFTEADKKLVSNIYNMTENKITTLLEQNLLITNLNTMFKNAKSEVINYNINNQNMPKKDLNNFTILNESDHEFIALEKKDQFKVKFNTKVKDLIISFLKEALNNEDENVVKNTQLNRNLKIDVKLDKNNSYSQIICDNHLEIQNKNTSTYKKKEIILFKENEIPELEDLVVFKRKERKNSDANTINESI